MKKLYTLLLLCAVFSTPHSYTMFVALQGRSFFSPRSQGTDAARDLLQWHENINPVDKKGWYQAWALTPVYERSFRPVQIAEYFFGTNVLGISGSQVATRKQTDLLADYFGLSPHFQSNVVIAPVMQNVIADLAWHVGYKSFFASIHAPITWTRTDMNLCESVFDAASADLFPAGYMAIPELKAPYDSFTSAIAGSTTGYGQIEPLQQGIMSNRHIKSGCADIHFDAGWHIIYNERGRVGVMAKVVVPTGNRPTSHFLFEPVVGNGRHVEVGFGLTGSSLLWEQDAEQRLDFLVDVNVMHLCSTHQKRAFDLIGTGTWQRVGNWGSRYILAKKFEDSTNYSGVSLPLINVTTLPVDINVTIQVDAALMLAYTYKSFGFDFGYNGWVRSKENMGCVCFPDKTYALKGIQNVADGDVLSNTTQSKATINGDLFSEQALVADDPSPVFIAQRDINLDSAQAPLSYSHKFFWQLYRTWYERSLKPLSANLGIGGFVEFEGVRPHNVQTNKNSLSQWGAWVKFGVGYS